MEEFDVLKEYLQTELRRTDVINCTGQTSKALLRIGVLEYQHTDEITLINTSVWMLGHFNFQLVLKPFQGYLLFKAEATPHKC